MLQNWQQMDLTGRFSPLEPLVNQLELATSESEGDHLHHQAMQRANQLYQLDDRNISGFIIRRTHQLIDWLGKRLNAKNIEWETSPVFQAPLLLMIAV